MNNLEPAVTEVLVFFSVERVNCKLSAVAAESARNCNAGIRGQLQRVLYIYQYILPMHVSHVGRRQGAAVLCCGPARDYLYALLALLDYRSGGRRCLYYKINYRHFISQIYQRSESRTT
jgi:hypothetical protein